MKTITLIIAFFMLTTVEAKTIRKVEKKVSNITFQKINNSKFINRGKKFSKISLNIALFNKLELDKIMQKYMHHYYKRKLNNLQKKAKLNIFKEIKSISLSGIVKKNKFNNLNFAIFLKGKIKQNSISFLRELFKELHISSYNLLINGKNKVSLKKLLSRGVLAKPKKIIVLDKNNIIIKYKNSFDLVSKKNNQLMIVHINKKYSSKTLLLAKKRVKINFINIDTKVLNGTHLAELKYDKFPIGATMSKIKLDVIRDKNRTIKLNMILNNLPKRFHSIALGWLFGKHMAANIFSKEKIKQKNRDFLHYLIVNSTLFLKGNVLTTSSWAVLPR